MKVSGFLDCFLRNLIKFQQRPKMKFIVSSIVLLLAGKIVENLNDSFNIN